MQPHGRLTLGRVPCCVFTHQMVAFMSGTYQHLLRRLLVANAPDDNVGIIVTNERHLVCLGADANKRKVQWSDQEDNTTWTPAAIILQAIWTLKRLVVFELRAGW
jgi:hypothetical protein